jgi:hypothetical protein
MSKSKKRFYGHLKLVDYELWFYGRLTAMMIISTYLYAQYPRYPLTINHFAVAEE